MNVCTFYRDSPRSTSRPRTGNISNHPVSNQIAVAPAKAQALKESLRLSLNNQSAGGSSPSDMSLRRNNRSPRREMDVSPYSVNTSQGTGDGIRLENRRLRNTERVSLTRSMDKAAPEKKPASNDRVESAVSVLMILSKSLYVSLLLFMGVVIGAFVVTGSADWIYSPSSGESPLWLCPSSADEISRVSALDGSSCELGFSFSSYSAFESSVVSAFQPYNALLGGDYQCYQNEAYLDKDCSSQCRVRCYSSESCGISIGSGSCSESGFVWGPQFANGASSDCMQTVSLSGINYTVTGASISAEPLCSSNSNLTPAMILTLRGELVSILVISMLVLMALLVKARIAPRIRTNVTSQKGLLIAKASSNELRSVVESSWDSEHRRQSGGVHPAKHFASSSWKYRVRVLHAMMKKRKSEIWRRDFIEKVFASLLIVLLSSAITAVLLWVLPSSLPFNATIVSFESQNSWTGNVVSFFSPLYTGQTFWAPGVWVDLLCLVDVILELTFVLGATLIGLRWQPVLKDRREQDKLAQIGASEEACLVLLVSAGTCLKTRGRDKLLKAVEHGVGSLKFGAVFVLDMGFTNAPLDDTWKLVSAIHPTGIHYAYLPDTNKQLGQQWLCQLWIPYLHKSGIISRLFKQMLVVDLDTVSENSLSGISLGGLNKLLMVADGNIDDKSGTQILLPITSDLPDSAGEWESNRLHNQFFNRMIQIEVTRGLVLSTGDAPESISIKDRRIVAENPDEGEGAIKSDPVQQALASAKRRGKLLFSAQTFMEPIACQNTIYDLFCNYTAQVPNSFSQLGELFLASSSLRHYPSLALKLCILLGPLVDLVLLVLRPFVLGSLLFRDPLALIVLLCAFWILTWTTTALHCFNRPTTFSATLVSYPLYLMYLGCMRVGLGLSGASFGRLADETLRPSNASLKDLYPCLPHHQVDWFTCWKTSDASRLSVLNRATDPPHSSDSIV